MKKEYIVPEIEVITFDDGDILTTSQLVFRPGQNASDNEGFIGWGNAGENQGNFSTNKVLFISLYIPKEKKGKGKGSANMLQNDSKWERKYLAQQNQPSNKHCPDGVAKAQGAMSPAVQE